MSDDHERRHTFAPLPRAPMRADDTLRFWIPEKALLISKGAAIASKCYAPGLEDDERTKRFLHAAYLTLTGHYG